MDKQKVRDRIAEIGVVPVVRASSPEQALLAAEAVCKGGIPIVEVTMTVPGAVEVIRELRKRSAPEVLIGAGTVLDVEMARRCLNAAAEFIEAGAAAVGIGGELVRADALKSGKPEVIVENARKYLAIVKQARARMSSPNVAVTSPV